MSADPQFIPITSMYLPVIDAPTMVKQGFVGKKAHPSDAARVAEMFRQMHREVLRRMAIDNGGRPKLEAVK